MVQPLSRECIRDTLTYKRDKAQWKQSKLALALYVHNIRLLRAGQLAPYAEQLKANRFRERMMLKRYAPDVVIEVRGGLVQSVRSSNPYTSVYVADYDRNHYDPEEDAALEEAEKRGKAPDMCEVY